ncbi:MAG: PspC domain-containing protein [Pontibacterium sp.]
MSSAKQRGYDINLYRSNNRWIAGVCGGIAKNMGWPPIGVRLAMLVLATISGSLAIFAYIAAIFLIANEDECPQGWASSKHEQPNLRDKVMSKENITSSRIQSINQRLKQAETRIRHMEEHVTSKKFRFDQELHRS